jgi:outer membrane murein-binding lipoprotein Lpp
MKRTKIRILLGGAAVSVATLGFLTSLPAQADEQALARQVQALTERVRMLEESVQQLKSTCSSSAAGTQSANAGAGGDAHSSTVRNASGQYEAEPWKIKEKWGGLHDAMTGEQVAALLGKPSRKFMLNGSSVWYYDYRGVGVGSVMLGRDGRIVGWQRPPVGWW